MNCVDCGASIEIPEDVLQGEILGCGDCGMDYVISIEENGEILLKELMIEGEDWGE
jgi:alpha-aminoadipate carrier protein LysW